MWRANYPNVTSCSVILPNIPYITSAYYDRDAWYSPYCVLENEKILGKIALLGIAFAMICRALKRVYFQIFIWYFTIKWRILKMSRVFCVKLQFAITSPCEGRNLRRLWSYSWAPKQWSWRRGKLLDVGPVLSLWQLLQYTWGCIIASYHFSLYGSQVWSMATKGSSFHLSTAVRVG